MRDVAVEAAAAFLVDNGLYEHDEWIEENEDAINDEGGDVERAWQRYDQGRQEALAHRLEADILDLLDEDDEDGDDTRAH